MYPQHTDLSQNTPNLPKTNPQLAPSNNSSHKASPFLNSNKTCPQLNNKTKLLIHLHLNPAMTVHFQIMAQFSKRLQQKIPVPYQRNRDTVYIRKPNRFHQFCLISLYRSKRNTSTFEKLHVISKCAKIFFDYQ